MRNYLQIDELRLRVLIIAIVSVSIILPAPIVLSGKHIPISHLPHLLQLTRSWQPGRRR